MPKILRSPHFLIVSGMFLFGLILHYPAQFGLTSIFPALDLSRHAIERILFLLPITYSGFIFGARWGFASAGLAFVLMLPRIIFLSAEPGDALLETFSVILVGALVNIWFEGFKKEKERGQAALSNLEATRQELQLYIRAIRNNEQRLASIKEVSDVVCQSLDMSEVLDAALDSVVSVMKAQVAQVFLLDDTTGNLNLEAYRGISDDFAAEVTNLKPGEGFNGLVAQTGETLIIEDASTDYRLTRKAVKKVGLHALITTPLRTKGRIIGTLCVARLDENSFDLDDLDMLHPIANHIAVAVENARLYSRERVLAEQIASDISREKDLREHLSYYLQQVTRAQEKERTRIARELHDETAQDLITISREVDNQIEKLKQKPLDNPLSLNKLRTQIEKTLDEVRRFSQDLRPSILDDLGLVPALEWLAASQSDYYGINIQIRVTGKVRRFFPEVELVLFRIAQEALRNVCRHSEATEAEVVLDFDEARPILTVTDNGKGFVYKNGIRETDKADKLGLVGMQERARLLGGSLKIDTGLGKGTKIQVFMDEFDNLDLTEEAAPGVMR